MQSVQESASPIEQTHRFLQLVHGGLLCAVLLYILVMHLTPVERSEALDSKFLVGCAIVALIDLAIATVVRSRKLRPAFETLRTDPNDPSALAHWRQGSILSGVQAMTVALFGMALHFVGAPTWQVVAFFVVGLAVMLFWWPHRP